MYVSECCVYKDYFVIKKGLAAQLVARLPSIKV